MACQPKCRLNYSENTICVWRVEEPTASFVPAAPAMGLYFPPVKSPGMCVLISICKSCITTGTNVQHFYFGEKSEILKYFFHSKTEQKVKNYCEEKKIQKFWCRIEELLNYLDKLKYLCFILLYVVLDSCSVGFSPPRTPHFPRLKIPGPAVT